MTEQLYYIDPNLLEFDCAVSEARVTHSRVELQLDRTAFYPEGGGQPSDQGTLDGLPVVDVRKQDGRILHVVELPTEAHAREAATRMAAAATVRGVVDGARRRDFMQQHTGQHIISAALMKVGEYATVSVHLGDEYSTIEIDASSIHPSDLIAVEDAANEAIERAMPVSATVVGDKEVRGYSLRRPPKVSGSIRLVMMEGIDCVACGGVHVSNTRQVRLVRLIGTESIRGRVRLYWKIGDRALRDYRTTSSLVRELGDMLSAQPHELLDRVRRQEERIREAEAALRNEREKLYGLAAERMIQSARTAKGGLVATAEFHDEDKEFLRGVAKTLSTRENIAASLTNTVGDQLHWCVVVTDGYALDFGSVRHDLLEVIDGKGGGKPPIWQGVGGLPEKAPDFHSLFCKTAGLS